MNLIFKVIVAFKLQIIAKVLILVRKNVKNHQIEEEIIKSI